MVSKRPPLAATTRLFYTPLDFLSPALGSRMTFIEAGPLWLGVAWVVWTVAFVWIAVAMTLRRANDAGYTPWIALLILVPLLNFLVMIFMACVPTREEWVAGAKETVNEDLDRLMSLRLRIARRRNSTADRTQSAVPGHFGLGCGVWRTCGRGDLHHLPDDVECLWFR